MPLSHRHRKSSALRYSLRSAVYWIRRPFPRVEVKLGPWSLDIFLCVFQSPKGEQRTAQGFAWQTVYGAFSVSQSNVKAVTAYISDQAEHHRKFSYQEELRELYPQKNSGNNEAPPGLSAASPRRSHGSSRGQTVNSIRCFFDLHVYPKEVFVEVA
jgi:hypothetical protein